VEDCFRHISPHLSESFRVVLSAGKKEGWIQTDESSKTPSIHGHKELWRLSTVAQITYVFARPNFRLHCADVVKRSGKLRPPPIPENFWSERKTRTFKMLQNLSPLFSCKRIF
jgi:hypothetical protein